MVSSQAMDRRTFLKNSGLLATVAFIPTQLWGCGDVTSDGVVNAAWAARADELEAAAVLTAKYPGEWSEKVGSHVPEIELNLGEGSITVRTNHGMAEDHYISTLYVRNQHGMVVGMQEFSGTDAEAVATFTLPKGTEHVVAYSYCTKHDHWKSDATDV